MSQNHGSRFSGGYQFPSTDSASFKREPPIAREGPFGPLGVRVELVPLTGGRETLFDIAQHWTDGRTSGAAAFIVAGVDQARAEYRRICEHYASGGEPPE